MAIKKSEEKMTTEEFLNAILAQTVVAKASDIHIEPMTADVRIRLRIDGVLQEKWRRPLYELEALLNRIKVLSNLDITTHSIPQDGHFEAVVLVPTGGSASVATAIPQGTDNQRAIPRQTSSDALSKLFFDTPTETSPPPAQAQAPVLADKQNSGKAEKKLLNVRVSLFPTIHGDTAVLRILNRADLLRRLDELEMDTQTLTTYKHLISRAFGMVLITGPAGSGKTTTLYATLQELKSPEKNIVTLEDPVEFNFEEFRQSQIAEHGLTFALAMRSILRQDPDALMVGEIRDPETAEQAIRASLTGRLVISTVHANTTIGTIARLMDMNIDRSLIAYALNGVMARRLVRKICQSCKKPYSPDSEYMKYFQLDTQSQQFMKGIGCDVCDQTGFQGRIGLFEVLELDNTLRTLIIERASMSALQEYVEQSKMKTLRQDATEKIVAGLTTVEEAVKAV